MAVPEKTLQSPEEIQHPQICDLEKVVANLTRVQRRFWQLLQLPEYQKLSIKELVEKAGYHRSSWYIAIRSNDFRALLETIGVKVLPPASASNFTDRVVDFDLERAVDSLTKTQLKFWNLLQVLENRNLTIEELCKKAGYKSCSCWYIALKGENFRILLDTLGIEIRRKAEFTKGIVPLAKNPDEEWAQDIVDVRRLYADYPKHVSASTFKLNFSFLRNFKLKALVKRYFRSRVGFWDAATHNSQLKDIKPFLVVLNNEYPDLESFATLTRAMVEPILSMTAWVDSRGLTRIISATKKYRMVSSLDSMFTYMQLREWEGAPQTTLIFDEHRPKPPKRRPRPIPEIVLEQLKANIHLLPTYAQNLVEILLVAGLRTEDALHLTEDCIEYDAAGDPRLLWFNHKMKRDGRPLPVTTKVVEAVQRQRELVKDVPDHYGKKYIFRTERGLYHFQRFQEHLQELSDLVPILGSDGEVYYINPHQFRHTVGTDMINNGMGIVDTMIYLDHSSPEMTLAYSEIYDETLKAKFKQVVMSKEAIGGAALQALREQIANGDESELDWVVSNLRKLSLPWGHCLHHAKANKCPYGQNACFTKDNGPCHKLVTTKAHIPVIENTQADLENSLEAAKKNGWEMYANDLQDQINGMNQVLSELRLPDDQLPKNRGGQK